MAKLIIIWCDNFDKNQTPLQRNGMAAIPKTTAAISTECSNIPFNFSNIFSRERDRLSLS